MIRKSLPEEANRFVRFAGVGALGTIAQYLTLTALVEFGDIDAVYASAAGFVFGAFVNYYLNYRYTFHSKKRHKEALLKFFTVAFAGLVINTFIMSLLTQGFNLHYLLAQIIATGTVLIWNFLGNRLWTFRQVQNATKR